MSQFELVSCRLAIQVCIGHFPDGRERHRTFSVKNIRPDADDDALVTVVRAIGSLLAYPITHARLIVKKRRVLFDTNLNTDRKESVAPETRGDMSCDGTKTHIARAQIKSVFAKLAEPTKIVAGACSLAVIISYFISAPFLQMIVVLLLAGKV
ncbi:MAG: hypothetical protein LBS35_00220 [Synergistaceae bacterium]|nr:hypothetical protein [Synergistaceae bacterium]